MGSRLEGRNLNRGWDSLVGPGASNVPGRDDGH